MQIDADDAMLMAAVSRIVDEGQAKSAFLQASKLVDALLAEPVDSRPPTLWHVATRVLPSWASGGKSQQVHRVLTVSLAAAYETVFRCCQQFRTMGTSSAEEKEPDFHIANFLLPLTHFSMKALHSKELFE